MGTLVRTPIRWCTYQVSSESAAQELMGQVVGPNTLGERFVIVDVEDVVDGKVRVGLAFATTDDVS